MKKTLFLLCILVSTLFHCTTLFAQETGNEGTASAEKDPSPIETPSLVEDVSGKRENTAESKDLGDETSARGSSESEIPPSKDSSPAPAAKVSTIGPEATESAASNSQAVQHGTEDVGGSPDSQEEDSSEKRTSDGASSNSFFRKLKNKSERSIKARIFAHYELSDKLDEPNHFEVNAARLNFEWSHGRVMNAALKYDFANLIDGDEVKDGLKDLYVRLEPVRWIGFQLGQFKKPFSQIELTSRKKLPVFYRGESNDYIADFLKYGGRDVGFMLRGRIINEIKLDYAAGIFNGGGLGTEKLGSGSKDIAFRLDAKPTKWLGVGASASARIIRDEDLEMFFDPSDYEDLADNDFPVWVNNPVYPDGGVEEFIALYPWLTGTHWMGEVDVSLKFKGFEAVIEATLGENWWFEESPYVWSVATIMSYLFPLADGSMAIEPAMLVEMMHVEDDSWTWKTRMIQVSPGVNVHFGQNVRLMIHGQFIKTTGTEADIDEAPLQGFWPGEWPGSFVDSKSLYIQLGFAN